MISGNKKLKNPFYFIKDKVIFNISNNNDDNDVCGKHYKTFDTESKSLKKGDMYIDAHGNKTTASADGTYNVSKGTDAEAATISANKGVFPYYEVSYSYTADGTTKTGSTVYWLDEYIKDGDKVEANGQFKNKTIHKSEDDEETMTYEAYFKTLLLEEIGNAVKGGNSKETIEKTFAVFMADNQKAVVDGKSVVVTNITAAVKITENDILNAIKDVIKEYGDKLLKAYEKECEVSVN